jgi:Coenzyme Q (ubiquinone) biosynthesis protein Coq4
MNPLYSSHILTTRLQKILLAMGSGFGALVDPTRDGIFSPSSLVNIYYSYFPNTEYIATFGETTANQALVHMRRKMLGDPEGSKILKYALPCGRPHLNLHLTSHSIFPGSDH